MARLDLSLIGQQSVRHIRQTEVAECGLACLAMVASFYGLEIDLNTLRRQHAPSLRGASLKSLIVVADQLGFACRPVKVPLEGLRELHLPAILHWDMNHYVVLEQVSRGRAVILDPAAGAVRHIPLAEVSQHFTGVAMEMRPTSDFKVANQRQRLRLRQLWGRMHGWKRATAQTLALTVVLQAFTLASPYYMQLALDSVVPSLDKDLLVVLAVGFGLFTIFNAGASLLRSFVLLSIGTTMGYALAANLARRLFRLPVEWFERRHVGDVLSRFQSVQPIQNALTQGLASSFVDGILAALTLALLFWYSSKLAFIALFAFLAYVLVRVVSFGFERDARELGIVALSKEQSTLIETVRGIVTLRLFGREAERHVLWQNRLADATNAQVGIARIGIWQQTANTLIFGIENTITVWLAITLVITGGFSIGMVFAYLAYKQQFLTRAASLIDQGIAFRMLGLHLDRLGDIALEKEDQAFLINAGHELTFSGHIQLRGVSYRYSPTDPIVLNDINLDVPAGLHIAITGPSGGGKSTLAKIILGLVEPDSGEVLIDGVPLRQFGYRAYRTQIAAVLQEDSLFAGSIADNIALFDETADTDRIISSAIMASIHHEIIDMPMKYETLVGDMGSALSGGQKARVLLARALYRQPRLLLLDEGTAHLDHKTEAAVNHAINRLGVTRLVIAHRAETIVQAERTFMLESGYLRQVSLDDQTPPDMPILVD